MEIKPIAIFHSPFRSKFGIPKQSGLVEELEGRIVFEPKYRNADYIRGIEGYDYIWLIWNFSANKHANTSPLVRPPLLGGNIKKGIFSTRSPFRPNPLGLSSVKLLSVDLHSEEGPILHVSGADIMDGTPIYDIKPYIAYADSHPNARSGFVDSNPVKKLKVVIPEPLASMFNARQLEALRKTLELDPRPHYHNDPEKVYGFLFLDYNVRFKVEDGLCVVVEII